MKTSFNFSKKQLTTLFLFTCINLLLPAQVYKTVYYNTAADSLKVSLTDEEKNTITDLKVVTATNIYLTTADFASMGAMPLLARIDLSEAKVVLNGTLAGPTGNLTPFKNKKTLVSFKFPGNVKNIAGDFFTGTGLTEVLIPSSVNGSGNIKNRFNDCQSLTAFKVDAASTTIQAIDGIVYSKNGQELVAYPAGKADSVYAIPETVTTVDDNAFAYNNHLTEISIPASVTTFSTRSLTSSTALRKFNVAATNSKYTSVGGILVDKVAKSLLLFPPGFADESLVIDGSAVESVSNNFFSNASKLKSVVFTEGFKSIGAYAFKPSASGTSLEYVELPSTLTTIGTEAFHGCANLGQIICHALTPPEIGKVVFRAVGWVGKLKIIKVGVPAEALNTYKTSNWIASVYPDGQGFAVEDIVSYHNILKDNKVICTQTVGIAGKSVSVTAGPADEGMAFLNWTSTPTTSFGNDKIETTTFTMPDFDVKITAVYSALKPYSIINGIVPQGYAAVGATVQIDAAPVLNGASFKRWEVIVGDGVIIANSKLATTNFIMIDGPVTIKAVYETSYMIDIEGGYANLEAFEGDTVSIEAEIPKGYVFDKWTSTTAGVSFANDSSSTTTFVMPASDVTIKATFKSVAGLNDNIVSKISLFPTIALDNIRIYGADAQSFKIYNITGDLINYGVVNENQPITVNNLCSGIYIVKIGTKSIKFIKK